MTREEFIKILEKEDYSYEIDGDYLVIPDTKGMENVILDYIKTMPSLVRFNNSGYVNLVSLETLPPGVEFNNKGDVNLDSLKTLPPDIEFNNGRYVYLDSLKSIPPGVVFNNRGNVDLELIIGGGYFNNWKGNINGIDPKRLLNVMIKKGMFI